MKTMSQIENANWGGDASIVDAVANIILQEQQLKDLQKQGVFDEKGQEIFETFCENHRITKKITLKNFGSLSTKMRSDLLRPQAKISLMPLQIVYDYMEEYMLNEFDASDFDGKAQHYLNAILYHLDAEYVPIDTTRHAHSLIFVENDVEQQSRAQNDNQKDDKGSSDTGIGLVNPNDKYKEEKVEQHQYEEQAKLELIQQNRLRS